MTNLSEQVYAQLLNPTSVVKYYFLINDKTTKSIKRGAK